MSGVKSTFHMMATTMGGNTMGMMKRETDGLDEPEAAVQQQRRPSPRSSWKPTVKTDRRT